MNLLAFNLGWLGGNVALLVPDLPPDAGVVVAPPVPYPTPPPPVRLWPHRCPLHTAAVADGDMGECPFKEGSAGGGTSFASFLL